MKRQLNQILFFIIVSIVGILPTTTKAQGSLGHISFEIKRGFLTISATGDIQIPTVTNQSESQQYTINLNNNFQIKDADGHCSGHYTTIQVGNLKNGSHTIPQENIFIKFPQSNTIAGVDNPSLSIGPTIHNIFGNFHKPSTYLYRSIGTDCGKVGQYSSTGNIQINVDPNQAAGNYRGQIYYLLIDHNQ